MTRTQRFYYQGDVNPEHGGYLANTANAHWDYADVVRIQPCSDAGGPDNCFWIESLTVNLPTTTGERRTILEPCGMSLEDWEALPKGQRVRAMIDACLSYGKYDVNMSEMVRIGAPDPFYSGREGEFKPDRILRGNTSLLRYAREAAHV